MTAANHFPGFSHPADELLKFLAASELFTIMLKTGEIIHFTARDEALFRQWLLDNNVVDIKKEEDWIIKE